MAQPVIGTPWQRLNQPVSEEELSGVDKYWRTATIFPLARFICEATLS